MKTRRGYIAGLMVAALLATASSSAHAQCEAPTAPEAAHLTTIATQTAAVEAMTIAINLVVETTTSIARAAMAAGIEVGWLALRDRFNQYWEDQQDALKGQAAQLTAANLDQTRQLGSVADAGVTAQAARTIQRLEYKARRTFVPTDEGCRFDTMGPYMGRAMGVTRGVAAAGVREITQDLGNQEGRASATGTASDFADRAQRNRDLFCNPDANGGTPGCTGDAGEFADAHVLPSRSLLGSDTYDVSDPRVVPAINELVRNLVGYEPANPVSARDMGTVSQRQARMAGREYAAQMDANAGMLWGIAAERMPAGAAPEIEQMRMRLGGSQPSSSPSEYELGQQIVERLWDPSYYSETQDMAAAVSQKQIYLRAYSVLQLYKLIEKTERLTNVYAIQTANMVERSAEGLRAVGTTGGERRPTAVEE